MVSHCWKGHLTAQAVVPTSRHSGFFRQCSLYPAMHFKSSAICVLRCSYTGYSYLLHCCLHSDVNCHKSYQAYSRSFLEKTFKNDDCKISKFEESRAGSFIAFMWCLGSPCNCSNCIYLRSTSLESAHDKGRHGARGQFMSMI